MPNQPSGPFRSARRALSAAALALSLAAGAAAARAQVGPEMPAPSPKVKLEQRVGVTDFAIEYSSPGVKGRKIWGTLVPYGELWRTGANAATKLTVSRDFTFGGTAVKAGSYALYTVPGKASWKVLLNTNANAGGTNGYDAKNDVATITVKPIRVGAKRERLTFLFSDASDDAVALDLEWEKLRVRVPIKVDTRSHVNASIEEALGSAWRPHFAAARYLLDSGGDLDRALTYIDTSIKIQATWWNHWVRAQILRKKNRKAEAVAAAQQAQTLGKGDRIFEQFFKADLDKEVATWR